jgi:hypothetical protein
MLKFVEGYSSLPWNIKNGVAAFIRLRSGLPLNDIQNQRPRDPNGARGKRCDMDGKLEAVSMGDIRIKSCP